MHIHVFRLFQVVGDYLIEAEDKGGNSFWAKPVSYKSPEDVMP